MSPNGSERNQMRKDGLELSKLNFNFSAFSINLGNMPQEQDRYLRILIAGSKKQLPGNGRAKVFHQFHRRLK